VSDEKFVLGGTLLYIVKNINAPYGTVLMIVKGYRVIGIPLFAESKSCVVHYIYLKEHAERKNKFGTESDEANSSSKGCKVLFVGNVDYRLNISNEEIDEYLRLLFSRFGEVESISVSDFEKDQSINSRFAHVNFTKKSAVSAALKASENEYDDAGNEVASKFGLIPLNKSVKSIEEIKNMYAFIDENPSELKEEVDQFMQIFEENEMTEKLDKEKRLSEADADGFMPVKNR